MISSLYVSTATTRALTKVPKARLYSHYDNIIIVILLPLYDHMLNRQLNLLVTNGVTTTTYTVQFSTNFSYLHLHRRECRKLTDRIISLHERPRISVAPEMIHARGSYVYTMGVSMGEKTTWQTKQLSSSSRSTPRR